MESNNKYILLLFSCHKYKHKREIQNKLWVNTIKQKYKSTMDVYHVLGTPDLFNEDERENFYQLNETEKILHINCPDDYISLSKKVILSYKAINDLITNHNRKYNFVFKSDDDQILDGFNFFGDIIKKLESSPQKLHYGGRKVVAKKHKSVYHRYHPELPDDLMLDECMYCNGRFYFLSIDAIQHLLTKEKEISKYMIEDYGIGYYLDNKYKDTLLEFDNARVFKDYETYVNANYYIFTECVNCPELAVNALRSYCKYHNYPVYVFTSHSDAEYLERELKGIKGTIHIVKLGDQIKELYNKSGHAGTANIWNLVIQQLKGKNKKFIHFDADVIMRGNIVDDIIVGLLDNDVVGPVRCYKHNQNGRDDIRHIPDVVSTYCFGFNPEKLSPQLFRQTREIQNTVVRMILGVFNPHRFPILDFFDPMSFDIMRNGGKFKYIDWNVIGGLSRDGKRENNYEIPNERFDYGEKIIHFASVGSGINYYKQMTDKSKNQNMISQTYKDYAVSSYIMYHNIIKNVKNKSERNGDDTYEIDYKDLPKELLVDNKRLDEDNIRKIVSYISEHNDFSYLQNC